MHIVLTAPFPSSALYLNGGQPDVPGSGRTCSYLQHPVRICTFRLPLSEVRSGRADV